MFIIITKNDNVINIYHIYMSFIKLKRRKRREYKGVIHLSHYI